ncbi:bifunctional dTDP-4-dehydrorhamnose 3,5-epimerase family protein/NAD(P)-dependent oxidoreductase [Nocardioides sp. R-C-SC26]|uniref:sugar nucleotide-binding protein n=1 Tax=Nocardioides sp. R-C-SC26 TaxID=2870414 RepID=UPI001E3F9C40|nr:bifunctional dTDP-4-dehydrorhamnose 3,5-epimerase family protein/NAD(P)-dependent oxidoreductase [Nocardioides sp. R-C-SC26]
MSSDLRIDTTPIPGLLVVHLPLHEDARGWFKESWQRQKMVALGLPDFGPVQNNVSFNHARGATRGIHAEPWDKFVSLATGRAFGAWVDLREGSSFGATFTIELEPGVAVFVPRGVGNSYQTLTDDVAYSYLVNDHWRPGVSYPALALDDPTAAIRWPIPLPECEISEKDRKNPRLDAVTPMPPRRPVVTGCRGQLGRALMTAFPDAVGIDRPGTGAPVELDLTDVAAVRTWPWHDHDVVLNAAAYTAVDAAEGEGRAEAWAANAVAPATLAEIASHHGITLVHYSTEYVFDGIVPEHREDEPVAPLGVYGQSKAAGEVAVGTTPRHYLLRTSWLIGDGGNFVRTMARLATDGVSPSVVDDQVGRLTFTDELVRATRHLLDASAPFGTYHVSNGGPATSWAQIAAEVFRLRGRQADDVTAVTTADYFAGKTMAPRPSHSAFDLAKLRATGFDPEDAFTALRRYLAG